MGSLEQFRHKLAWRLREEAERRWTACAGNPSGQDLKVIALCERLAADAETLTPAAWSRLDRVCRDEVAARHLADAWDSWPATLSLTLWPRSAAELVAWMADRVEHDPTGRPSRRLRIAATGGNTAGNPRPAPRPTGWSQAFATDSRPASALRPALAVWQLSVGLGQWRDAAFAATHAAVPATVLSVTTDTANRDVRPPSVATLAFTPAKGEPACHVAVPFGPALAGHEAGATLAVVPRATDCAAPLIPSAIGDPATSFTLAAAFLAGGLVSIRLWSWLSRRGHAREPEHATLVRTLSAAL